jgi:ABC-type multidrug transport system fused ATPase/permease subunit
MVDSNSKPPSLPRRLWEEAKPDLPALSLGMLAMLASSYSNRMLPKLMSQIIDTNQNNHHSSGSPVLYGTTGMIVLGGGMASLLRTTVFDTVEARMIARLREKAFGVLIHKDIEWFQNTTTTTRKSSNDDIGTNDNPEKQPTPSKDTGLSLGAIGNILMEDCPKIAKLLTNTVSNVCRAFSSVVLSTFQMWQLSPSLLGVSVGIVPLVGAAGMVLRRSIKSMALRQRELDTGTADFVQERLQNLAMVRQGNREQDEVDRYNQQQKEIYQIAASSSRMRGVLMGFLFSASASALLLIVNMGGRKVRAGVLTGGQLTSFATYTFLLGLGTSSIVKSIAELMQGLVAAERYYRLVNDDDADVENRKDTDESTSHEDAADDIEIDNVDSIALKNVCFSYKSTGKEVLHNISIQFQRGKVLALVGKNGAGKSTIASLLAGWHRVSSGEIQTHMMNGEIKDYTLLSKTTKKKLVQVIPQNPSLFNLSILENVRYCNPDASMEAVQRAMTLASCDDFGARLPGGIQFVVGVNGCKLSGGERQKLALARALLSDPMLLIMDEPCTSLDADGASAVEETIQACGTQRALLLITHQAKSLKSADQILVLREGNVVEQGTLDSLRSNPRSELCKIMPSLIG